MDLTATRGQAFQCKHVFYKAVLAALLPFIYQKLMRKKTKRCTRQRRGFKLKLNFTKCDRYPKCILWQSLLSKGGHVFVLSNKKTKKKQMWLKFCRRVFITELKYASGLKSLFEVKFCCNDLRKHLFIEQTLWGACSA